MHGVLVAEVTEFGGASTPSTEASLLGGASRKPRGSSLGATHPQKQSSSGDLAIKEALGKAVRVNQDRYIYSTSVIRARIVRHKFKRLDRASTRIRFTTFEARARVQSCST